MGAPIPKMEPIDSGTAEALLSSLKSIDPTERRKHASIFNYWLSIRGDRQFPPIRDLDPLEISDAGPWSVLLELISQGENAVIRHIGQDIKLGVDAETIARAPSPSLLACIHAKLPAIASSMQAMAFEDSFEAKGGETRCWVTLLPFSANGASIDYVYGYVSLDAGDAAADQASAAEEAPLAPGQVPLGPLDADPESAEVGGQPVELILDEPGPEPEPAAEAAAELAPEPFEPEAESEPEVEPQAIDLPLEPLVAFEPEVEPESDEEPVAELPEPEPELVPGASAELALEPEIEAEEEFAPLDSDSPPKAGFSARFMESLASVGGFYGRVVHPAEPVDDQVAEEAVLDDPVPEAPVAEDIEEESASEEPVATETVADEFVAEEAISDIVTEPTFATEGTLQSKLTEVRAMAEEARQAQLRAQDAIIAGLSAAYDFALDAEGEPEEYLRLVEGQGLKIQLRAPMKPVVKLAFADTCDDATIGQLEAVLAWALKQDLPRGTLADRIEAEGGIGSVLEGLGKAA